MDAPVVSLASPPVGVEPPTPFERWIASPFYWALLVVLGAAARFRQYLFAHSYWYDESYLVNLVRERGFTELVGPQPDSQVIPPLFLGLERALFLAFGDGERAMRFPAFVAGIAALFLMAALARRIVGGAHAVWAVGLLVVSRHAISHSCEAHPYASDLALGEAICLAAAILLDGRATSTLR